MNSVSQHGFWAALVTVALCSGTACTARDVTIYVSPTLQEFIAAESQVTDMVASLSQAWYATFEVSGEDGVSSLVNNCQKLFAADKIRQEPVNPSEFGPYREVAFQCYLVRSITKAKGANKSYLTLFKLYSESAPALPVAMAFVPSQVEYHKLLDDKNINNLGDFGIQSSQQMDSNVITITTREGNQRLTLYAKGDFNDDGLEDVLIGSRNSIPEATYAANSLFVISRQASNGPLVLVKKII